MVTRSGTNQIRGTLFWANHNSGMDASSWFNNFTGAAKNFDNRNQFGGRIGGPIIKNKTLFFALFDGHDLKREKAAGNTLSAYARQGIFRYFPGVDNGNAVHSPVVDRSGNPLDRHTIKGASGDLAAIDLFGNCTFNGAPVSNCRSFRGDSFRPAIDNSAYIQETLRRMPAPNEFTAGDGLNPGNMASPPR